MDNEELEKNEKKTTWLLNKTTNEQKNIKNKGVRQRYTSVITTSNVDDISELQQKDNVNSVKNEKHGNDFDKHHVVVVAVVVTCILGVVIVLGSMWIYHLQTDTSYHKFYFRELQRELVDMAKNSKSQGENSNDMKKISEMIERLNESQGQAESGLHANEELLNELKSEIKEWKEKVELVKQEKDREYNDKITNMQTEIIRLKELEKILKENEQEMRKVKVDLEVALTLKSKLEISHQEKDSKIKSLKDEVDRLNAIIMTHDHHKHHHHHHKHHGCRGRHRH